MVQQVEGVAQVVGVLGVAGAGGDDQRVEGVGVDVVPVFVVVGQDRGCASHDGGYEPAEVDGVGTVVVHKEDAHPGLSGCRFPDYGGWVEGCWGGRGCAQGVVSSGVVGPVAIEQKGWGVVDRPGWCWERLMAPFAATVVVLVMLVLIVSFTVAASTAARDSSRPQRRSHGVGGLRRSEVSSGRDRALEELRLRYARGEIGREEFLQRKIDLE